MPGYIVAQILGGVAGAALVYVVYQDAIQAYEDATDIVRDGGAGSIGIFVTGPARYFGNYWGPFLSEVIGTAFLLIFVFAVVDLMNLPPQGEPGAARHRPRRLRHRHVLRRELRLRDQPGPRLRPADPRPGMMGWGDAAFPGEQGNLDAYWWVPIVGPDHRRCHRRRLLQIFISDVLKARSKPEADRAASSRGETVEDESDEEADQRPGRRRRRGPARLRGGPPGPGAGQPRPDLRRARRRPREGQGRRCSPAAAPATSRCTAASSGRGMLDAACPGEVFTSPTPDQMYEATKAVDGGAGVLHIVKNYTGDVLNFEMAAELARADGIEVEAVVTDDDVAVQDSLYTAGRRGVGITVLAEKIVGAAAEEGQDLAAVAELCRRVNARGAQHGHGAHLLHGARGRQAHLRAAARTRWRSASASTASRAASA